MRVCIFGAGGFGHELISPLISTLSRAGAPFDIVFVDDDSSKQASRPVITLEEVAAGDRFVIAVGDGQARQAIETRCIEAGLVPFDFFGNYVSLGAELSFGPGLVLCDYSMVTARIQIGRQFQANIYSYVAHDCIIGDYVTFAPRVSCNGNVRIGDFAYLGAGAIIRNGSSEKPLTIGEHAIVGMGAVVTKDVPPGAVVLGNPARLKIDAKSI